MQATRPPSSVTREAEALAQRSAGAAAPAAIERVLSSLLAAARAAWPALEVAADAFVEHLGGKVATDADVVSALEALHGPDLYLALGCSRGDPSALSEFERLYIADVPRALSRLAPTRDFVEEVQQSLRERLLVRQENRPARIADYSGRGALGAWVRIAAVRTALSLRRARKEVLGRRDALPEPPARHTDPDAAALRRRYGHLLKSAVQTALGSLPDDDRELLRLHVIDGLTVAELGARHGVHASTISRRVSRIRRSVLDEARRLLSAEGLRESEFKSVVRALRTDLDVSIERILAPDG